MEMQKFTYDALELKFGGIDGAAGDAAGKEADASADKKLAGTKDDAATLPRASATRSAAELSSLKFIASENVTALMCICT